MTVNVPQSQSPTSTDRIEKHMVLRAPRARVWRALTIAEQFGAWFRVKVEGEFAAGETIRGRLVIPGYEHVTLEMLVERIEPEHYFSYRWHPYAVDPKADYSAEPTIIESGFDRIPLSRRAEAFRMNDQGWASQSEKLARYVEAQ